MLSTIQFPYSNRITYNYVIVLSSILCGSFIETSFSLELIEINANGAKTCSEIMLYFITLCTNFNYKLMNVLFCSLMANYK